MKKVCLSATVFLIILCFATSLKAQFNMKQVKFQEIFSINEVVDPDEYHNMFFAITHGYDSPTAVHILRYSNEKNWPEAINTKAKRDDPATKEIIRKYRAYEMTTMQRRNYSGMHTVCLMFIPKELNQKMPEGFRPETDLFFFSEETHEITKKVELLDYRKDNKVVTENYDFLDINKQFRIFKYLKDMKSVTIRRESSGNTFYSNSGITLLNGFYEVLISETPTAGYSLVNYYDAGNDASTAGAILQHMRDLLLSGEFHLCGFAEVAGSGTGSDGIYEICASSCNGNPICIRLCLVENKTLENRFRDKPGWNILLILKEAGSPADTWWQNLYLEVSQSIKAEGYIISNISTNSTSDVDCGFKLSKSSELWCRIFVSDADARVQLVNEKGEAVHNFSAPVACQNEVWCIQEKIKTGPGQYLIKNVPGTPAAGRWLAGIGEKTDAAAQAIADAEAAKIQAIMDKTEQEMIAELNRNGYVDLKFRKDFYDGVGHYEERIAPFSAQTIQVYVATLRPNLRVRIVDKNGHTLIQSEAQEKNKVYTHAMNIKTTATDEFKIIIEEPATHYAGTILYYGFRKK